MTKFQLPFNDDYQANRVRNFNHRMPTSLDDQSMISFTVENVKEANFM